MRSRHLFSMYGNVATSSSSGDASTTLRCSRPASLVGWEGSRASGRVRAHRRRVQLANAMGGRHAPQLFLDVLYELQALGSCRGCGARERVCGRRGGPHAVRQTIRLSATHRAGSGREGIRSHPPGWWPWWCPSCSWCPPDPPAAHPAVRRPHLPPPPRCILSTRRKPLRRILGRDRTSLRCRPLR
jgi:hypothetical protein